MDGKVDPRKTTVDLNGLLENENNNGNGSESYFTFTARDKNGNPVESNTVFASKIINNESGVETEVVIEERGGGNYRAKCPKLQHGMYLVVLGISSASKIIIQDMVKGSPFTIRVGPDPSKPKKKIIVSPLHCYLFGPGAVRSVVKRKSSFVIQACGDCNDKVKIGGGIFRAKIIPPVGTSKLGNLPCNLVDQQDGTYVVSYCPNAAGNHIVHITESDSDIPIRGSPFIIQVAESIAPGEEVDPSSAAIRFGQSALPIGSSVFAFPISARSVNGGQMQLSLQFHAKVLGPTGLDIQHKLVEQEDGGFLLKFVPKYHGKHQFYVDVCTNGNENFSSVSGSPSELDLQLTTDDDGGIGTVTILKVSPIVKTSQEEKKHPASAPTSPVIQVQKIDQVKGTPPPAAAAAFKLNRPLQSGSNNNIHQINNNNNKVPPKNPATKVTQQRRFSSPPAVIQPLAPPPPKNPAPGSPLSAKPPAWLVAAKKQ